MESMLAKLPITSRYKNESQSAFQSWRALLDPSHRML